MMKLSIVRSAILYVAHMNPVEARPELRRISKQLTHGNAELTYHSLLFKFKATFFEMRRSKQIEVLEAMACLCELAKDKPIMLPAQPQSLVDFPAQAFDILRPKRLRKKPPFIGGCFHRPETEKAAARYLAVYLQLTGFTEPFQEMTEGQKWYVANELAKYDQLPLELGKSEAWGKICNVADVLWTEIQRLTYNRWYRMRL